MTQRESAVEHLRNAQQLSLEAVDWYNTRRSGVVQDYRYEGGDRDTTLENARGIFNTVGMGGLRVALVE